MSLPLRALVPALAAISLIGLVPLSPARAAEGLQVVSATTYQLLPAEGRVHVRIDATATSHEPESADGRVVTGLSFSVQPGIANLAASSAGTPLATNISQRTDEFTEIELTFAKGIGF
jgi:hypothetical protein